MQVEPARRGLVRLLHPHAGEMAEGEREHERCFRERLEGHPLTRFVPLWKTPAVRDAEGGAPR